MAESPDERPSYLLLLAPAPSPSSLEAVRSAYEAPLTSVLTQLAEERRRAADGACIDIAVPLPILASHGTQPRSALYPTVQAVVAAVYKLVCVIAAKYQINVEDAAGFDVRVILVAGPDLAAESPYTSNTLGAVISLPTLAGSGRVWSYVFSVDNQAGERLLHQYLRSQDGRVRIRRVRPGSGETDSGGNDTAPADVDADASRHSSVLIGGTWDHVHIGHKLLLNMLAFVAEPNDESRNLSLAVGITGDELLRNKKFPDLLESWRDRQDAVMRFLKAIVDFRPPPLANDVEYHEYNEPGPNGHAIHYQLDPSLVCRMVEISDPYGPSITEQSITALVVSAETRAGGKAVNDKRREQGWTDMELFEIEVLDTKDEPNPTESFESKISSTEIRKKLSSKRGGTVKKLGFFK